MGGESNAVIGPAFSAQCYGAESYEDAYAICVRSGARLCTVDCDGSDDLAREHGIRSLPTFKLFRLSAAAASAPPLPYPPYSALPERQVRSAAAPPALPHRARQGQAPQL